MDGQLEMNQIMSGESARSPSQKIATFQNRKKKSEINLLRQSIDTPFIINLWFYSQVDIAI